MAAALFSRYRPRGNIHGAGGLSFISLTLISVAWISMTWVDVRQVRRRQTIISLVILMHMFQGLCKKKKDIFIYITRLSLAFFPEKQDKLDLEGINYFRCDFFYAYILHGIVYHKGNGSSCLIYELKKTYLRNICRHNH